MVARYRTPSGLLEGRVSGVAGHLFINCFLLKCFHHDKQHRPLGDAAICSSGPVLLSNVQCMYGLAQLYEMSSLLID